MILAETAQDELHRTGDAGVREIPVDSQLRDLIDRHDQQPILPCFADWIGRLQRCKWLQHYQIFDARYLITLDGSRYFSSEAVHCAHCLTTTKNGTTRYHHDILQAAIVHPDKRQVLPLAPEFVRNSDAGDELGRAAAGGAEHRDPGEGSLDTDATPPNTAIFMVVSIVWPSTSWETGCATRPTRTETCSLYQRAAPSSVPAARSGTRPSGVSVYLLGPSVGAGRRSRAPLSGSLGLTRSRLVPRLRLPAFDTGVWPG